MIYCFIIEYLIFPEINLLVGVIDSNLKRLNLTFLLFGHKAVWSLLILIDKLLYLTYLL